MEIISIVMCLLVVCSVVFSFGADYGYGRGFKRGFRRGVLRGSRFWLKSVKRKINRLPTGKSYAILIGGETIFSFTKGGDMDTKTHEGFRGEKK